MNIPKALAKIRFYYHANMIDVADVINQLGIIDDEKMEEMKKKHVMIIFTDIFPRFGFDITKDN